jgi:hypothetical protein
MLTEKKQKKPSEYCCNICHFVTSKKNNYITHLTTAKHKKLTSVNTVNKTADTEFLCPICSKNYSSRVGLWSHKKKCFQAKSIDSTFPQQLQPENALPTATLILDLIKDNKDATTLILDVIKDNQDFKNLIVEQQKENKELINKMVEITHNQMVVPTNITNNNNNSTTNNNQTFNLNFFLNETCKDAMNIQDFIDNIKITFEDLLVIGNSGFVNGLSDIFIKQLQDMEVNKRPIHCTDSKRETIYLKESDAWNKDNKDKSKLKQFIEKVEYKNVAALRDWCNENPDSKVNNTPNNFLRDKIYLQTLQGDDKTRDKIIKNISKEVVIDKET